MISKIFKCHLQSCNYFFAGGKQAPFMMGQYVTAIESEIAELTKEVTNGHPHIYIDANECEIDSEALTPMELLRIEMYEKAKADLLASGAMSAVVSESSSAPAALSFANTTSVQEGAAGSNGDAVGMVSVTSKLSSLKGK